MNRLLLATMLVAMVSPSRAADEATPVLVELFTSEGCSSCPPADELLSRLAHDGSIRGIRIVPIGWHVDYWDALGWKDPLSSADATKRQQTYAAALGLADVYTPQMIVDGRDAFVGSDERLARQAIQRAAARPHARLAVRVAADGGAYSIAVELASIPADAREPLDAFAAIVEDGLTSVVRRGENGGRTLHHDAGLRRLVALSRKNDASYAASGIRLQDGWNVTRLTVVALVQGRKTRAIWGAASAPLASP
jgi:hypothetical protein